MMRTIKYTNSEEFKCLEDLNGTSTEITLIHTGRETCMPYHAFSGIRDEYIIHFILSGHGFYSAGGSTWPLAGGQMFLIYPNETVTYCADRNDPWSYFWVGFKGSRTEAILKQCGFSKERLTLPSPDPNDISACMNELFAHVDLNYSDSLYRESVLLKLFAILNLHYMTLASEGKLPQDSDSGNIYVNRAIDYINETYMKDITVADIADHLGISRTHLNHVFQDALNLSVQNFLMTFRMERAAILLTDTSDSVKEISRRVGYVDPLVFSKAFKRKFGISPKQYRTYKEELEIREKRPV